MAKPSTKSARESLAQIARVRVNEGPANWPGLKQLFSTLGGAKARRLAKRNPSDPRIGHQGRKLRSTSNPDTGAGEVNPRWQPSRGTGRRTTTGYRGKIKNEVARGRGKDWRGSYLPKDVVRNELGDWESRRSIFKRRKKERNQRGEDSRHLRFKELEGERKRARTADALNADRRIQGDRQRADQAKEEAERKSQQARAESPTVLRRRDYLAKKEKQAQQDRQRGRFLDKAARKVAGADEPGPFGNLNPKAAAINPDPLQDIAIRMNKQRAAPRPLGSGGSLDVRYDALKNQLAKEYAPWRKGWWEDPEDEEQRSSTKVIRGSRQALAEMVLDRIFEARRRDTAVRDLDPGDLEKLDKGYKKAAPKRKTKARPKEEPKESPKRKDTGRRAALGRGGGKYKRVRKEGKPTKQIPLNKISSGGGENFQQGTKTAPMPIDQINQMGVRGHEEKIAKKKGAMKDYMSQQILRARKKAGIKGKGKSLPATFHSDLGKKAKDRFDN